MIRISFLYKKWSHIQFLVTVDEDVRCRVTLGDFQSWLQGGECSLTYQCSISSEKTKVTQFARLCKITTCLPQKETQTYTLTNSNMNGLPFFKCWKTFVFYEAISKNKNLGKLNISGTLNISELKTIFIFSRRNSNSEKHYL